MRVIRTKFKKGGAKELSEMAKQDGPDASKAPGLVAYYVVEVDKDQYATVGVFDAKKDADEWAKVSREYGKRKGAEKYLSEAKGAIRGFDGKVVYAVGTASESAS